MSCAGLWHLGYRDRVRVAIGYDPATMVMGGSLALTALGSGVSAGGTLASGSAAKTAGEMQATALRNESRFTATQLKQNAATARATGGRAAIDTEQQSRMAQSELTAKAAGSGLSASGATPTAIGGQIAQRGEYLSLMDVASGENKARGFENEATATEFQGEVGAESAIYQGDAAKIGSLYSAAGTLASGAGSLFQQYGTFKYPTQFGRPGAG